MSRRRRRGREPGRLRKTVEVLVSGLFGVAVVCVVVLVVQNGSPPAPDPAPSATVSGQAFPTGGAAGGIRNAETGAVTTPGQVRSASTGSAPSPGSTGQGAVEAQQTGATKAASATAAGPGSGGSQSTPTAGSGTSDGTAASTAAASASPSASSTSQSGLVGVVGGLVGGVLGLL